MKIKQELSKFNPITIILETRAEAQSFIDIVDRFDGSGFYETQKERDVLIDISNAFGGLDMRSQR